MKQLITIEWLKLKRLVTMKVILLVYMVLVPTMYLLFQLIEIGPLKLPESAYQFPDAYQMATYCASWFNLTVGVVIVVFTTNEIKFKTMRQNVIDGLSKGQLIWSKFYVIFGFSLFTTIYTTLVAIVVGLIYGSTNSMLDGIEYIGVYFVSTLGYFSFAFFFANLIRLPALAIVIYIFSTLIEGIVGLIVAQEKVQFFPLSVFSNLTPFPMHFLPIPVQEASNALMTTGQATALACVYVAIFMYGSYWVIKKRDV